jgi:ribosome-binding protein aMBF1 (putative translation factor)
MKPARKRKLAAAGWRVGSARQFLELTDVEEAFVELKLVLTDALRRSRTARGLSQVELAERMRSSQSRVAKIETGDPSVSLDLIVRALIAVGITTRDIGRTLARG